MKLLQTKAIKFIGPQFLLWPFWVSRNIASKQPAFVWLLGDHGMVDDFLVITSGGLLKASNWIEEKTEVQLWPPLLETLPSAMPKSFLAPYIGFWGLETFFESTEAV